MEQTFLGDCEEEEWIEFDKKGVGLDVKVMSGREEGEAAMMVARRGYGGKMFVFT